MNEAMEEEFTDDPMAMIREKLNLAGCTSPDMKVAVGELGYFTLMGGIEAISKTRTQRLNGLTNKLRANETIRKVLPLASEELMDKILGDREITPAMALLISTMGIVGMTLLIPEDQPQQNVTATEEEEDPGFVDE